MTQRHHPLTPGGTIAALTAGASFARRARPADAAAIVRIIEGYAGEGILLPRPIDEVTEQIGTFRVAELDGEVVGLAALREFGDGIGELRSLSVEPSVHGHGFGEMLVRSVVRDAKRAGIRELYALTASPGYFALFGFREVPWDELPAILEKDRGPEYPQRQWNTAMVLTP